MKAIFFTDIETAEAWLEDYRLDNPCTTLKIRKLAGFVHSETGQKTNGGFVIAAKPSYDYIGKYEIGYADTPYATRYLETQ